MWFSYKPEDIEQAKQACQSCPIQTRCLAGALERKEFAGVWGGSLLENGNVILDIHNVEQITI